MLYLNRVRNDYVLPGCVVTLVQNLGEGFHGSDTA
jgi:hypothetical protein